MNSKGCVRVEALGWMAFIAAANRKRSDAEKYVSKMQKENGRMIFDVIHPFLPKELKKIKNSFSHLVFGKMSERENNYNQAIQEYQWVIDNIAPNQIPVMTSLKPVLRIFALNSLAQIYEKQGNESEALKLYNEILKHKTLNITQSSCAIIWRDLIRKISENKE
jgi:tetratricopeptide (TPR) repeat protein